MPSSGVPARWAATERAAWCQRHRERHPTLRSAACWNGIGRPSAAGDVVVVSVHWGSNWGYRVPAADVRLAHRLIDGGVDVVCTGTRRTIRGRSRSTKGKLVLYGCGDLIDDYEGIAGHEEYRDDLRLLYLATIHGETGRLSALRMVPFQARQLRLHRASAEDSTLLANMLDRISRSFGSGVDVAPGGTLVLKRMPGPA